LLARRNYIWFGCNNNPSKNGQKGLGEDQQSRNAISAAGSTALKRQG